MTETPSTPTSSQTPSSLVLRLLSTLTTCLALGDLVWFIATFPIYFRWFSQGWMSPAIPLFLLWTFLGIPSLVCAVVAVRLARSAGRPGRITKLSFHLILAICTLVPILASLAAWNAGTGGFPWGVWLVTFSLSAGLWYLALHVRSQPGP